MGFDEINCLELEPWA